MLNCIIHDYNIKLAMSKSVYHNFILNVQNDYTFNIIFTWVNGLC